MPFCQLLGGEEKGWSEDWRGEDRRGHVTGGDGRRGEIKWRRGEEVEVMRSAFE
jgi:hypothetical protein